MEVIQIETSQIDKNSKKYIAIKQDKLWLLSCSEIWNNGDKSGHYGYAVTKEGNQYKYYANINANYNVSNTNLVKTYSRKV